MLEGLARGELVRRRLPSPLRAPYTLPSVSHFAHIPPKWKHAVSSVFGVPNRRRAALLPYLPRYAFLVPLLLLSTVLIRLQLSAWNARRRLRSGYGGDVDDGNEVISLPAGCRSYKPEEMNERRRR
uniref:Uncharacterized protein n=1 Tax=Mycena chlorophos TaxID=658473 RepID=A0ABQ0M757_MYCCL|nr:predicted protein [Mycena chlorophos]